MAASTIRSITSRPIATLVRRSLGCWTRKCHIAAEEEFPKIMSDKRVFVEATLVLEGVEPCELKTVLSLVQQHFSIVQARKAVFKHLASPDFKGVCVHCRSKVRYRGYEASDIKSTLHPWLERYHSVQ